MPTGDSRRVGGGGALIEPHALFAACAAAPGGMACVDVEKSIRNAFALAIMADGEGPAYPGMPGRVIDRAAAQEDADRIAAAAAQLRRLVPDAGSYVSKSNYFNPRWQAAHWGGNHGRLRAVKDRCDPQGLFFGHNGVGSEDWSRDGFTRLR